MARKRNAPAEETPQREPGAKTAEEIHAGRREAEAEQRSSSGLGRHGERENEKR